VSSAQRQVLWLVLFSIAMGFLETAVVVYLRQLYYPNGFQFPLITMSPYVGLIEVLREAATVIMLLGVGILAGRTMNQRLAFFVAAFAIWDLSYYVFLKIILGWPESWLTWDILFLIPVPWIGPVLSPCLVCLTMLLFSAALYLRDKENNSHRLSNKEWTLILAGCVIVVLSWTLEFLSYASSGEVDQAQALSMFVPQNFNWWLFALGEALILAAIVIFWRRTRPLQASNAVV